MFKCTIGITRYREDDYLFINSLVSLAGQKGVIADVIVVDQSSEKNDVIYQLIHKLSSQDIRFTYVHNSSFRGLSEVRNYFLKTAINESILYIDSDAAASPDWASSICSIFENNQKVSICGTKIVPFWLGNEKSFHSHQLISGFYSMLDLGFGCFPVKKIIGASFGVRRDRLNGLDFATNLGRIAGNLGGGEETDLCIRAAQSGSIVFYTGDTYVHHYITQSRLNLKWLIKLIFSGGWSRGYSGKKPEPNTKDGKVLTPINLRAYFLVLIYIVGYGLARIFRRF